VVKEAGPRGGDKTRNQLAKTCKAEVLFCFDNTREAEKKKEQRRTLTASRRYFVPLTGPKVWHALPPSICEMIDYSSFNLKRAFDQNSFLSILDGAARKLHISMFETPNLL
jgi:hypothetical protein